MNFKVKIIVNVIFVFNLKIICSKVFKVIALLSNLIINKQKTNFLKFMMKMKMIYT